MPSLRHIGDARLCDLIRRHAHEFFVAEANAAFRSGMALRVHGAADRLHRCAFAYAISAEDTCRASLLHRKIDAEKNMAAAVICIHTVECQYIAHRSFPPI